MVNQNWRNMKRLKNNIDVVNHFTSMAMSWTGGEGTRNKDGKTPLETSSRRKLQSKVGGSLSSPGCLHRWLGWVREELSSFVMTSIRSIEIKRLRVALDSWTFGNESKHKYLKHPTLLVKKQNSSQKTGCFFWDLKWRCKADAHRPMPSWASMSLVPPRRVAPVAGLSGWVAPLSSDGFDDHRKLKKMNHNRL